MKTGAEASTPSRQKEDLYLADEDDERDHERPKLLESGPVALLVQILG
jgi:hypothetical protein